MSERLYTNVMLTLIAIFIGVLVWRDVSVYGLVTGNSAGRSVETAQSLCAPGIKPAELEE